ncbi:hypothetical protein [Streptomyces sp. NPDC057257]|uniref:hypothetical protein n=1 Tax=Streptomyces sp. NPDC057257 TaxID=3346071 RepID=UPI00362FCEA0
MAGRILRRGRLLGLAALFLVGSTVVSLGLEGGGGILLHVTQSVWVELLVYPALYVLAFLLLLLMVPHMEEFEGWSKGWVVLAMIVVPIAALVVTYQTYTGLDQRALHARGQEERATVTDVYWVDGGADPPAHVAQLADPSGQLLPGTVSGDGLKAGQTVTVTVDPRGEIPVLLGTPSTGSGKFRTAGIAAGVEILFLAWAAYRGAADRLDTKTTDKPKPTQRPDDVRT